MNPKARTFLLVVMLASGSCASIARADSYDNELKDKRAAERLQRMIDGEDERGREAALRRERGRGPPQHDDLVDVICIGIVALVGLVLFRWIQGSPPTSNVAAYNPRPIQLTGGLSEPLLQYRPTPATPPRLKAERKPATAAPNQRRAFMEIINAAIENGVGYSELETIFRSRWGIDFSIKDGKLNITEENLRRTFQVLPQIKFFLNV